jgi:group II intron reverse transcriptase/maturase
MRARDNKRVKNLQKLILKSRSARLLAIRQVTQLNIGAKTAGIDGKVALSFKERLELDQLLKAEVYKWKHQKLRKVPIPKKDGTKRILKIPTISDRAWQCLIKYAIEPAHEATFHERSYGFRPGRSTHDCQKIIQNNLASNKNGINKRILELDIEKCFDRIHHGSIMCRVIAPRLIKAGLWRCLKSGTEIEFPEQGTPQGGVISPLLANIALNGIEKIHPSVRYADDMVCFIKPGENPNHVLLEIEKFLKARGLRIKVSKTKLVDSTEGFNFLGWHFYVQSNGKFRSVPSKENFQKFRQKVKTIVNNSNYGALIKAIKLAPVVRGWRNYHRYCKMDGSKFSLWFMNKRANRVFRKESKVNREKAKELCKKAFPAVPYKENAFVSVKGDASPFDGNVIYWSERNSKYYDGVTAKTLKKQNHSCSHCGLRFNDEEKVHLHHINGNHNDWKQENLLAVHQSCHQYIHMGKGK